MGSGSGRFALRRLAAAVGLAFALGANAQQSDVQAGLERATRTPLEIVWLRAELWSEIWRDHARLVEARTCSAAARPREGCVIDWRAPARFHYGPGTSVAPGSYFDLAGGTAAPFRLAGASDGVYLVLPESGSKDLIRSPSGEVLLAAGRSMQLIHPAYPAIHVQLSAPAERPLPLGNLAAAGSGAIFALLVRQPDAVNATAAALADGGRVVLRSTSETQVAARSRTVGDEPPLPALDAAALAALSGSIEAAGAAPAATSVASAHAFAQAFGPIDPGSITLALLEPASRPGVDAAEMIAQDLASIDPAGITVASLEPAPGPRADAAQLLAQDFASIHRAQITVASSGSASAAGVDAAQVVAQDLASIDPATITVASLEPASAPRGDAAQVLARDFASIDPAGITVASLEPVSAPRADAAQVLARDFASIDPAGITIASAEPAREPRADAVQTLAQDFASLDAAELAIAALRIETPAPRMDDFVMVAAAASVPIPEIAPVVPSRAADRPAGGATPEITRLRAEVEAEIARDRERVAETLQSCARTGSYRQGCAVGGAPKRFVFAGA